MNQYLLLSSEDDFILMDHRKATMFVILKKIFPSNGSEPMMITFQFQFALLKFLSLHMLFYIKEPNKMYNLVQECFRSSLIPQL